MAELQYSLVRFAKAGQSKQAPKLMATKPCEM